MKREYSQIFAISVLSLLLIALSLTVISAAPVGDTASVTVDQGTWYFEALKFIGLGFDNWQEIVVGIITFMIIAAGIYDMLQLVSIFDNTYVKLIMAIGIGMIAGIFGLIRMFVMYMGALVATLGAFGIFLEIGITIVIFIGLSFGSMFMAKFAAKRKAAKKLAQGTVNAAEVQGMIDVAAAATKSSRLE